MLSHAYALATGTVLYIHTFKQAIKPRLSHKRVDLEDKFFTNQKSLKQIAQKYMNLND